MSANISEATGGIFGGGRHCSADGRCFLTPDLAEFMFLRLPDTQLGRLVFRVTGAAGGGSFGRRGGRGGGILLDPALFAGRLTSLFLSSEPFDPTVDNVVDESRGGMGGGGPFLPSLGILSPLLAFDTLGLVV